MAITFNGGLTVSMSVADLDRAIAWYGDVLGWELLYKVDDIAWAELKSSVDRVQLGLSESAEKSPSSGTVPTFGTEDIAAAKAHLDAKGVRQDGDIMEVPGLVKLLTFYDPDDNALMLYEELEQAGA